LKEAYVQFVAGNQDIYQRNCSSSLVVNECGDATFPGVDVRVCLCRTDYCNAGERVHAQLIHLITALIVTLPMIAARLF